MTVAALTAAALLLLASDAAAPGTAGPATPGGSPPAAPEPGVAAPTAAEPPPRAQAVTPVRRRVLNRRIEPEQAVGKALLAVGLAPQQVDALVAALSSVFDCRRSRAGDQLRFVFGPDGALELFDYRQGPLDEFHVRRSGERFLAVKRAVEVEKKVAVVELKVESSLYEAALAAGEDPLIAMVLSDVFAWDVDFYRDVQKGDRARAVVEKYVSRGRILRYGDVLAATYDGSTVGKKRVFRYQPKSGNATFFQEDGASARKTFLKSPLKFAHITSGFGSRFHPVLQYVKDHNGVDYGTPVGTPVWAVADGTVLKAQYDGAAGNHVCVRHFNGMETCYLHLSRFAPGVRGGARVAQKQVIAFSGNTGRTTGPHLHFALKRGGRYVNPLNQNFPRADPLPKDELPAFHRFIFPLAAQLDASQLAASGPSAVPLE